MNVVAGVIERDGRVLICQRKGGRHALKWEFPGGKVEPGEEPRDALAREPVNSEFECIAWERPEKLPEYRAPRHIAT